MALANPKYTELVCKWCDDHKWMTKMTKLSKLVEVIGDPELEREWTEVRRYNKEILGARHDRCTTPVNLTRPLTLSSPRCVLGAAAHIEDETGIVVDLDSLFDVHVKRIHGA